MHTKRQIPLTVYALSMTTIVTPITSAMTTIVLVTILLVILLRLHIGRFSEATTLLRLTFLLLLATDSYVLVYLVTYFYVNMPYSLGSVVGMLVLAVFVAFCIGGVAPLAQRRAHDEAWSRYFKERDRWEEERRERALTDKE